MRLVKTGTKRSPRTLRSSRAAAFLSGLNSGPENIEEPGKRFPPRLRRRLLFCSISVTLVAIAVRAPLLGTAYTAPDTSQYLAVAHSIFHGGFPNSLRPPGYSLLLAVFEAVGANPVTAVVLLQNLIGIALPAGVLLVGWRFFSPAVGLVAGFLAAASPLMIITEQLALADYLFGVVLFAATVLLAEAVLRIRAGRIPWRLLIAAGVAFGIATLFRANGLLGLIAIPVALLAGARNWRSALRASAASIAAMLIVLAPWSLHNLIRFGDPSVASESGISLYARAISWDQVPPRPDSADGRLALSIYNTADISKPRAELATTIVVFNALVNDGKTAADASSAMGAIAREEIFRDPATYLAGTIEILGLYQSLYDPHTIAANKYLDQIITTRNYFRSLDPTTQQVPGDSGFTRGPWQVAQTLTELLYVITLGGALTLLLPFLGCTRSRLAATTFLIVLLFGVVGGSLTSRWEPRYDIVFAPIVWVLLAAATALIAKVIVSAVRQRPRLRTRDAES